MDLPLSEKAESLIQKHLASGKFATAQQVVEEALTQLDQQAADWASVNDKIQQGVDDINAGRFVEIASEEDEERLTQEILRQLRQRNLLES
ncbi:hypothetical protein [Blastopirellula marina]|uniref:Type II toxin-antitoxin system ParD family antitoxin n=1 Tax=Blastopirellula marina TaxID=124 RepID=A0A2S8GSS1_9BACT|nr:hypothetical protein [Blastopirellula marina]PQO36527.1 hypothetical protein C5Y98_12580 [Blastopirellula marina]PQO47476.1 hypothetical protein C5Y93_05385 [Blastopirellula marina]PTL44366.1 hypothetical protein C5Y97_12590 [Blastopirellula marina]